MSRERAVELMQIFDRGYDEYKRSEVAEALGLREEMLPLLIGRLDEIVAEPESYLESDRFGHNYAVPLLATFRDPSAHNPIIRAFSLPGEVLDEVWAEIVTEMLPALLCSTAGSNYDAVKTLVLNREVDPFVRAAALEAIKLGVAQGDLSRDEALSFYSTLFDSDFAVDDHFLWNSLVFELLDLCPTELMARIRELYDKGLVTEEFASLDKIEMIVEQGTEKTLAKLPERLAQRVPMDVHDYISWFACFNEDDYTPAAEADPGRSQSKKKQKARKKRKQAKIAKRKNRR